MWKHVKGSLSIAGFENTIQRPTLGMAFCLRRELVELRACLAIEEDWVHDPGMDAVLAVWTKQAPVPFESLSSMLPDD